MAMPRTTSSRSRLWAWSALCLGLIAIDYAKPFAADEMHAFAELTARFGRISRSVDGEVTGTNSAFNQFASRGPVYQKPSLII
jgi:hypothetical protein